VVDEARSLIARNLVPLMGPSKMFLAISSAVVPLF